LTVAVIIGSSNLFVQVQIDCRFADKHTKGMSTLKLVSWNVNGLRSCVNKGFLEYVNQTKPDVVCVQETKLQAGQIQVEFDEPYQQYWNYAEKKGYSGTAIFSKEHPLSVRYGLEEETEFEGRLITLEFATYYLVTVYTPNAKRDLSRLPYRLDWDKRFRHYILQLDANKPVILCGDLNVAHQEIDLKNAKANRGNSGFTDEERENLTMLLDAGFADTFRYVYPNRTDAYSWWSNMPKVRERNVGWRIDYFLVSSRLRSGIVDTRIDSEVMGSDHCPVVLDMNVF